MIRFDAVEYRYPHSGTDVPPALHSLNFELEAGSFHFLTGPSGAGKTTVFKMLYHDILPTRGSVHMFGKNIAGLSRTQAALLRRKMGIVYQDFRLLDHLTVRENVALPLTLYGSPTPEQLKSVDDMLAWVGLTAKRHEKTNRLSGGEKQRVAIARAVVNKPELLIADEPTGNIDATMAKRVMHLLVELNKHGTTVLVVTHDHTLVKTYGYPCLNMDAGTLAGIQVGRQGKVGQMEATHFDEAAHG
jgi:cell division transport system ATP-binding protein